MMKTINFKKVKSFLIGENDFMKFLDILIFSTVFTLVVTSQYVHAEDESLYLNIHTESPVYKSSKEIGFKSSLRVGTKQHIDKDQSITIRYSRLVIKDLFGNKIYLKGSAFHHNDEEYEVNVGSGFSGIMSGFLKDLAPGEYTAVWEVDGYISNIEKFKIDPHLKIEDLPALVIKPLGKRVGYYGEPLLILYFVNKKDEAVNLYSVMVGLKLWIDGIAYERNKTYLSDYGTEIQAQKFWSNFISLDDYNNATLKSGLHEVQLEFSGKKSNMVKMQW